MKPSQIRERILADHDALRKDLEELDSEACAVLEGDRPLLGVLRSDAERLLDQLQVHMRWEERYLLPALRNADAWGRERAQRMLADHREQRDTIALLVERLRDQKRPAAMIARDVAGLVELLRLDMREEERDLLDERVLRDDVIGIDVATG